MKTAAPLIAAVSLSFFSFLPQTSAGQSILVPRDYPTIQGAVDAAGDGDLILVAPGNYAGAVINKRVTLQGQGLVRIVEGVPWMAGSVSSYTAFRFNLFGGGDGARIINFTIDCDSLLRYGVYSHGADNVTVRRLKITNPAGGVVNYNGNGWTITHNLIRGFSGGGEGIVIGEYIARTANDNLVAFNQIDDPDIPEQYYSIPGIILASYYNGQVKNNRVIHNRVRLGGYDQACGVELYDGPGEDTGEMSVADNRIRFNDFRGCGTSFIFYPDPDQGDQYDVETANLIDSNLGDDLEPGRGPRPRRR